MAEENEQKVINIIVKDQNEGSLHFKIKMITKMGKVMDAYCQKKGVARNQLKFAFDGNRINDDDTPAELEMEDNDTIDVFVEQIGGFC